MTAERRRVGRGPVLLVVLALLGGAAWFQLGLTPADLGPREGGWRLGAEFLRAAFTPALDFESAPPPGSQSFFLQLTGALYRTLIFAAAAMGLAVIGGLALGFLGSSTWWSADFWSGGSSTRRLLQRTVGPAVQGTTRLVIVLLRSVHELLWAVLFLAAFGLNTGSAVLALAIPYTGTLAKVFAELLDEAPRGSAFALRAAGAGPGRVFVFGTLPHALPDMAAYAFYRFECAVRSSAILGFFGFETLGYFLRASFEDLHFREVWSYLYVLIALVLLLEAWSGALRRRFVA